MSKKLQGEPTDGLHDLLKRIASLERAPRTRKGKYPAGRSPYKPIMLLVVLRRLQQGKAPYVENRLMYEACERDFAELYSRLYGATDDIGPKASQAFWYLGAGSPQIWTLVADDGAGESLAEYLSSKKQIKSATKLNKLVSFAHFNDRDWALVSDTDVQKALMSFLISEHFPDVRQEIRHL